MTVIRALIGNADKTHSVARGADTIAIDFARLPDLPDAEIIEHLTQVKGIGVWTAQMFLMFALRRNDVLPVADLGIRSAIKKAYNLPDLPKPAEMEAIERIPGVPPTPQLVS